MRIKIVVTAGANSEAAYGTYRFNIRYLGTAKPVAEGLNLGGTDPASPGYRLLWKTPANVRTGRYDVDLRIGDPTSSKPLQIFRRLPRSWCIRQSVQIITSEVGQSFYSPGDSIACSVKIDFWATRRFPDFVSNFPSATGRGSAQQAGSGRD